MGIEIPHIPVGPRMYLFLSDGAIPCSNVQVSALAGFSGIYVVIAITVYGDADGPARMRVACWGSYWVSATVA